jgi:hypothetical protein
MPAEADSKIAVSGTAPVAAGGTPLRADKTAGENIAAEAKQSESAIESEPLPGIKNSVDPTKEPVATHSKSVGTSVANFSASMNNQAFNQSTAVAPTDGVSAVLSRIPDRQAGLDMMQASSANSAVESALQVGDHQAAATQGTQSSVNLRFNVGGEDLAVRVALQAGQVHTQFNTASSDLRSALSHEWQAAVPSVSGVSRFAEPVFTGGSRDLSDPGQEGRRQSSPDRGDADEPTGIWGAGTPSDVVETPSKPNDGGPTVALNGHLQSFA